MMHSPMSLYVAAALSGVPRYFSQLVMVVGRFGLLFQHPLDIYIPLHELVRHGAFSQSIISPLSSRSLRIDMNLFRVLNQEELP